MKVISRRSKLFTPQGKRGLLIKVRVLQAIIGMSNRELQAYLALTDGQLQAWYRGKCQPSNAHVQILYNWVCSHTNLKWWRLIAKEVEDMKTLAEPFLHKTEYIKNIRHGWAVEEEKEHKPIIAKNAVRHKI